ncbi:MAG: response regulator, partial [Candidatus Sumerlaeota bacterium]|nr:response regulator [Candidatus Sumerlaeota bacterium]
MAGETILVIDDSAAVQDVTTRVLEEDGYRVSAASNGVAALAYPDIASVDLAIVDSDMDGFDGPDTIKALRAAHETFHLPVLLLVPESRREQRASQSLHGAQGYLLKPFEAGALKRKVATLLEERKIDQQARLYLQTAADRVMEAIAQEHVQAAIEKRTQIIAERMIQNLVALVDQHARREVEAKVTSLSAEKEQELVRLTVNEVAQSMVEKLAERKV